MNKKEIAKRVTDRLTGTPKPERFRLGDTILVRRPAIYEHPRSGKKDRKASTRQFILDTPRKLKYWQKREESNQNGFLISGGPPRERIDIAGWKTPFQVTLGAAVNSPDPDAASHETHKVNSQTPHLQGESR